MGMSLHKIGIERNRPAKTGLCLTQFSRGFGACNSAIQAIKALQRDGTLNTAFFTRHFVAQLMFRRAAGFKNALYRRIDNAVAQRLPALRLPVPARARRS